MRFFPFRASVAMTGLCALALLALLAFAPQRPVSATVSVTPPCTPNLAAYHGMLPEPPVVNVRQNQTITMNVLMGPTPTPGSGATQSYCYVLAGSSAQYIDAPTIRVRQGETFTLNLVDKIPAASPTSSMPPQPQMTAPDGCALLPYDPAMPSPAATAGYIGHQRVFATMPPDMMIENDTNFHTHGWHVAPDVDNVFKSLARSAGDACTYTFAVPLTQPVGTYWYHAHLHGIAGQQVGGGLAGALVVLPIVAPTATPLPERVILLKNSTYAVDPSLTNRVIEERLALRRQRLMLSHTLTVTPTPLASFDPFNPPPWPSGWAIPADAPRCDPNPQASPPPFMSHWVVNGYPVADPKFTPAVSTPATVMMRPGARELYRIVDGMSDSYANIVLLDANGRRENLDVVGRDGVPINPDQTTEDLVVPFKNVLLPPAGRVDIVVTGASTRQTLIADKVCTGYLGEYIPVRKLMVIKPLLAQSAKHALMHAALPPILHATTTSASALHAMPESEITKRRAITFTQYSEGGGAWYVTDTSTDTGAFIEHPFWLTEDPSNPDPGHYLPEISVPQNSVEDWTLINASGEIHAFHIHQLTFVTLKNTEFEGPHLPVFQERSGVNVSLSHSHQDDHSH
jgi:FtsP/CotA-like multicopper oxidase with cupredoxin domain